MAISFEDFKKVNLRVAKVLRAEAVEGSEKLVKLTVDLGETDLPVGRQIVAGIRNMYSPEALVGKLIIIAENLEPRKLMGIESHGMLLAASGEDGPVLLVPECEVLPGSEVK